MSDKIHYHLWPEGSSQKTATKFCHKKYEILFKPEILFHCDYFNINLWHVETEYKCTSVSFKK